MEDGPRRVDIRLLGPVEVTIDGRDVSLGGPRQRALLALLALRPGVPRTADNLIDELWEGEPPNRAETTLRSYVSRLRQALGDAAPIDRSGGGYTLAVSSGAVDVARFEANVRAAGASLGRGAVRAARQQLADALAEWRGRPFGDLEGHRALEAGNAQFEELRLFALEQRIDADLELGRSGELVDELETLVREHPFRERLWRHLMLALYRNGRQADALAAYRRARAQLDEQLGIEPGEELRTLEAAILRQEVPGPTVAGSDHPSTLPVPISSFVGRETELAALGRQLRQHRLVTLTGVGGVGKTRLALELARRARPDYADGAAFADLSPLSDPALVPAQVAQALDVREHADAELPAVLASHVRGRELLLVIDNCEHVRGAAAELAERLLLAAPALRILATSRTPLGVSGEVEEAVAPLRLSASGDDPSADASGSDAVRLFLARARGARPGLGEDAPTIATATRICADLEGLPLAIELAAARARSLSLDDIAARLDDRFRFLVSWRRVTTARHRTLREAMDWSHELLAPNEQAMLAGLSVFAGGFGLDAAAAVCAEGDDDLAVRLIEALVDASLVIASEDAGASRYRLLETVRQYAAQRLEESGHTTNLRARHATWCLSLAEAAVPELSGEHQGRWFARLEAEQDNLRAALAFLVDSGRWSEHLRLAIALTRFWYVRGHLVEGRASLSQSIEADPVGDPVLRRRALTAAASFALLQGDYPAATRFAEESLVVARATGEPRYVANALSNLGAIVHAAGDIDRAGTLLEEAVAVGETAGDERILALAVNNLGDLALTRGEYQRAGPLFERSLASLRTRGDTANVARSLFNLGAVELKRGRRDEANARFREGLGLARDAGDREDLAWLLLGLAAVAADDGDGDRAGRLLGASGSLLEQMGAAYKPFERSLRVDTEARTRELVGTDGMAPALAAGAALELGEAIEVALGPA